MLSVAIEKKWPKFIDVRNDACNKRASNRIVKLGVLFFVLALLSGCGALHTSVKKRNLDVQTKMSETIFLEPVRPDKKVIYVSVRNTSDKELDIKSRIKSRMEQAGYKITDDPEAATFMIQANVLQVGKSDLRSTGDALAAGHGGALAGAVLAGASGGSGRSIAAGGLLGAIAGTVADAMVDDTLFSMITDLQVRERPLQGESIKQTQTTNASQGTSTRLKQETRGAEVNWKTYRTRIVSTANKANLDFEEALPALENGLVRSISGMFSD